MLPTRVFRTTNTLRSSCRSFLQHAIPRKQKVAVAYCSSAPALETPSPDKYPPKIEKLADDIVSLSLLEASQLNDILKSRLNISDMPVMMGGLPAGVPAQKADSEDEEAVSAPVKTAFAVKLEKFDAAKKVALIKELKSKVEGMNLVQAKKLVESAPTVIKQDLPKDEAEALSKALTEAGGSCVLE